MLNLVSGGDGFGHKCDRVARAVKAVKQMGFRLVLTGKVFRSGSTLAVWFFVKTTMTMFVVVSICMMVVCST